MPVILFSQRSRNDVTWEACQRILPSFSSTIYLLTVTFDFCFLRLCRRDFFVFKKNTSSMFFFFRGCRFHCDAPTQVILSSDFIIRASLQSISPNRWTSRKMCIAFHLDIMYSLFAFNRARKQLIWIRFRPDYMMNATPVHMFISSC